MANIFITQSIVPVTSASALALAYNINRKYLMIQNIGAVDVTIVPSGPNGTAVTAVAGQGMVLSANSGGAGKQGGAEEPPNAVPVNAFYAVTASGSGTLVIWEG